MEILYFAAMAPRYSNPYGGDTRRTLWDLFLWRIGIYDDPIPRLPPPSDFVYPASPLFFDQQQPSAVWIGHSTFLIELESHAILTDPVWDTYCSPIPIKTLKRRHDPPVPLSDLPRIDFVLISHNHYDHLDDRTIRHLHAFHPQIQWIIPLGLGRWFRARGIDRIWELDWWKEFSFEGGSVTAVPAQHFSGRTLWDQNQTFWNGYVFETKEAVAKLPDPEKSMILSQFARVVSTPCSAAEHILEGSRARRQSGEMAQKGDFAGAESFATASKAKRFYFTGDTGYNPVDFKMIGERWPHMDLSLIPIGTYVPQKFMQPVHCSPREAVEIHSDVKSHLSIGMHWKTFCLSEEPMDRPPYDLFLAMSAKKLSCDTFLAVDPGVYVNW